MYLVLPNLAFILIGRAFFINRALVNSDYLFLWISSSYLSRRTTSVLYLLLVVLDLILSTESIYHFSTAELLVMAGEILKFYPITFYLAAGALFLLTIAVFAVTRERGVVRQLLSKRSQLVIGTVALVLSAATVMRSSDAFDRYLDTFGASEIVASGVIETGLATYRVVMASQHSQDTMPVQKGATAGMKRDLSLQGEAAQPYDIVIILVESQGLLKSARDMNRVLAPLIDPAIQARYAINTGNVRFFGATMFGELRTLCRIYVPQAVPQDLPRLDQCWPNVLGRHGYETVSYHGFGKWFYERYLWYPQVGFQRSYFAEELRPLSPPMCGIKSHGVCDLWIAGQVENELLMPERKTKKFIYWLTLNSHLPVDADLAGESSFDCASTATLQVKIAPCNLARIHHQLYARIAQIALNRRIPPTRFIIVGDHMPPFTTLSERALYDETRVPFVELVPRQ